MKIVEELKTCKRCKTSKPISQFRSFLDKKMGRYYFRSYCKKCLNIITNERRMKNQRLHEKKKAHDRASYFRRKEISIPTPKEKAI